MAVRASWFGAVTLVFLVTDQHMSYRDGPPLSIITLVLHRVHARETRVRALASSSSLSVTLDRFSWSEASEGIIRNSNGAHLPTVCTYAQRHDNARYVMSSGGHIQNEAANVNSNSSQGYDAISPQRD